MKGLSSSWVKMEDLSPSNTSDSMSKNATQQEEYVTELADANGNGEGNSAQQATTGQRKSRISFKRRRSGHHESYSHAHFRVYKRRWFGLLQLVLLNIVASWDWLTFAPVSTKAADYFNVSETAINWLSTAFMFSFIVISPVTVMMLHKGPKTSMMWSSALLLVGNWIRYGGTRANSYGAVMFGQILTGLSQPFVLAAPTRYSDLWFTERGRVGATALASLANPFGGAVAQLVNPAFGSIPDIVLYTSIIATVACVPTIFLPATPPSPPSASSSISKTPIMESVRHILRSPSFYLIFFAFSVYVGFFNAFSSLMNQILYPYGFTEDEAGYCGAVLILVGLVMAAVTSPIIDKTHAYLIMIKVLCTLVAISYLAIVWAPQTRGLAAPYVLAALLGAASFSLLPVALEYLVEVTFPASPEVGSTICWAGGQLLGGIFIVIMNTLKDGRPVDLKAVREAGRSRATGGIRPPGNMYNALVFQAVVALVTLPLPLLLGVKRLGMGKVAGRLKVDEHRESNEENGVL